MTELKTVQPKDASRPRRSWLVPALVAGLAVVVGLAVVPAWDRGPASPQEVADAYMEARDLDSEAITDLFASDATVWEDDFDLSEMPSLIEFYRAVGFD